MTPLSVLVFTLPVASTRDLLTANERSHWTRRARLTKHWREAAAERAREFGPVATPAHVTITFSWPDNRRRDVGNLHPTAKACVDGVVDANVLPDDSDRYITGPDLRREYGPLGIRVEIRSTGLAETTTNKGPSET